MRLHEYQAKQVFSRYEIPIPRGRVADSAEEAKHIAIELGGHVVLKAQVKATGRGGAGGIRLAKTPKEAEELAAVILGMEIKGLPVHKVLIDEAVSIQREIYLGVVVNRHERCPMMLATAAIGMDISDLPRVASQKIYRVMVNPLMGLQDYQARELAIGLDLPQNLWRPFMDLAHNLWAAFCQSDALLAEINPLVITTDRRLLALDCKMNVDDNALFRHPEFNELRSPEAGDPAEVQARKYGLSFVRLDGQVGCISNGAGLSMATMDVLHLFGGRPANFLDVGDAVTPERLVAGLRVLVSSLQVRSILIHLFGSQPACEELARGLLMAVAEVKTRLPITIHLSGPGAEVASRALADCGLAVFDSLVDAAQNAVYAARGGSDEYPD